MNYLIWLKIYMYLVYVIICHYNPSNIFARARLVLTRHVTEYSSAKTVEYVSDIPQFSKLRVLRKTFEG